MYLIKYNCAHAADGHKHTSVINKYYTLLFLS